MILEVAILDVIPGKEIEFEKAFANAQAIIASMKGYIGHSLNKCIEKPNRYLLQANWETLEDHTIGFRQSQEYKEWSSTLHKHYDPFPTVEHYEINE